VSPQDSQSLGRRLRSRRAATGRTVASVAAEAGLSVPYIANLENDRGNPTLAALDKLARALGARLHVALVGDGTPTELVEDDAGRADRLARNPRLVQEVERLAARYGIPEERIRQQLLDLVLAIGQLKQEPLTSRDMDRTLDLAVLTLRRN